MEELMDKETELSESNPHSLWRPVPVLPAEGSDQSTEATAGRLVTGSWTL